MCHRAPTSESKWYPEPSKISPQTASKNTCKKREETWRFLEALDPADRGSRLHGSTIFKFPACSEKHQKSHPKWAQLRRNIQQICNAKPDPEKCWKKYRQNEARGCPDGPLEASKSNTNPCQISSVKSSTLRSAWSPAAGGPG